MEKTNIFEKASRLKLRFPLNGNVPAEDLWDAKLESLYGLEESLTEQVNKTGGRRAQAQTKETEKTLLMKEIVTYVIDTRLAEADEAKTKREKAEEKKILRDILYQKEQAELLNLPKEELIKRLSED